MEVSIRISQKAFYYFQVLTISAILLLCFITYVFTYLTGYDNLLGLITIFDVGAETSIPTFFSVFNLLIASVLALFVGKSEELGAKRLQHYWIGLSVLLLCMSIDESAGIHERLSNVKSHFAGDFVPMVDSHGWLLFGAVFVILVGAIFVPFLIALPRRTALLLIVAGVVFVVGAVGLEFVGAWMLFTQFADTTDLVYGMRRIVEEGCEMFGVAILNCALFREAIERSVIVSLRGT